MDWMIFIYLIFDNHIIALAEHPELFEGIAWVPLDDNTKNAKSFIEVIENILEEISQLMPQRAADSESHCIHSN